MFPQRRQEGWEKDNSYNWVRCAASALIMGLRQCALVRHDLLSCFHPCGGSMSAVLWAHIRAKLLIQRHTGPRAKPGFRLRGSNSSPFPKPYAALLSEAREATMHAGWRLGHPFQWTQGEVIGWEENWEVRLERKERQGSVGWVEDWRKEEVQKKHCGKICEGDKWERSKRPDSAACGAVHSG